MTNIVPAPTRERHAPVEVVLNNDQLNRAMREGRRRQRFSSNRPDTYGFTGDGYRIHQQGCLGEIAVALWRHSSWLGFSADFKGIQADVDGLQVRTTDYRSGRLTLHPKDNRDQAFVLCRTHELPAVLIVGWVWGDEAMTPEHWGALPNHLDRPCYWVPNHALRDPRDLP